MKRILMPALLVAVLAVGIVMAYSIWSTSPATPEELLRSGMEYFENEEYSEAIVQLLNTIQTDRENRDAHYYLALSYLRQGNPNAAAQLLNSLLEYFPDDVEAALELGSIYLAVGRENPELYGEATRLAEDILEREPENVDALVLSGNAAAGLQDYSASAEQFEQAVSLDPQNAAAYVSLGVAQALQTNYPEAEEAFLQAFELDPQNQNVLMSLGNYHRARERPDEAEATFEEALSLYPTEPQVYLQLVQFYYQSGRFAEVERVLMDAQQEGPEDPGPSLLLTDLYPSQDRGLDARELLVDLKVRFPENVDVAARLAVQYLENEPELARQEIEMILEAEPENPLGQILLGELQFFSGDLSASETTFTGDQAFNSPFPQPHFFLGQIAQSRGQFDEAASQYREALALNAGYIPARLGLADALLNSGRTEDSRAEITTILNTLPGSVEGRILKATLDRSEGNSVAAEQELSALVTEQPDNPLVHRQMALLRESGGRIADAERSFQRVFELQPDSLERLTELTQFYIRQGLTDLAIETVSTVPDDRKEAVHYEQMGMAYLQDGQFEAAEQSFQEGIANDPNRTVGHSYLTAQYIQTGRLDDALDQLDELISINSSDVEAYGMKGLVYQNQGNIVEAKANFTQALAINPVHAVAANNLAYILAEEGEDLTEALDWARVSRRTEPDDPNYADTLGWIYYKLGNYRLAIDQLEFAVSERPEDGIFQYHLGLAYVETGQLSEARIALERAVGTDDFDDKELAEAVLEEIR